MAWCKLPAARNRRWSCWGATIASGMTATMIIRAMTFGLIVPKLVIDHFADAKFLGAHGNARWKL